MRAVAGRLEWRLPDASCNDYAALAATLLAGLAGLVGMDRALAAPAPCQEDLYERFASGAAMPDRLPRDLCDALAALEDDAALRATLGEAFCAQFLALKRAEWDAYQQQVSPWELARYADAF